MLDANVLFGLVLLFGWVFSIGCAGNVGAQKRSRLSGMLLGLFFGPLGVIAAGFLDARPQCRNCGGRLNGTTFPVCAHCGIALERQPATKSWHDQLEAATKRLVEAGCVNGE